VFGVGGTAHVYQGEDELPKACARAVREVQPCITLVKHLQIGCYSVDHVRLMIVSAGYDAELQATTCESRPAPGRR